MIEAMWKNKKSVFSQVLYVNIILSIIFILVFIISYSRVEKKIEYQNSNQATVVLETLSENFQLNFNNLSLFLEQCQRDGSFIMALSDKLTIKEFIEYGKRSAEKLELIRHAFPYAEGVFAYSKNNEKFITHLSKIWQKDLFYEEISKYTKLEVEDMPVFENLENGFYIIGDSFFYVYQYYNYGCIIIQIDAEKFCLVGEVGSVQNNYEIVVCNNQNEYLAGTIEEEQFIEVFMESGENYRIHTQRMNNGFEFILIEKTSILAQMWDNGWKIYIVGSCILFLACVLLIYLNTVIYRPLRLITEKYIQNDRKTNELYLIHNKIDEILLANKVLKTKNEQGELNIIMIELSHALSTGCKLPEEMKQRLENLFEKYRLMILAIQDRQGRGEHVFEQVNNYFVDQVECKILVLNQFLHVYIISADYGMDIITKHIDSCFAECASDMMAFVGISDIAEGFEEIHEIYNQCYCRMMNANIPFGKTYTIVSDGNQKKSKIPDKISMENINTIVNNTVNGNFKNIQMILEKLFYGDKANTLQNYISYYVQLKEILITLINNNVDKTQIEQFSIKNGEVVYNITYMYNILVENYEKLNQILCDSTFDSKYEVVDYIDKHYKDVLSLDSVAEVFGISPVYLSAWFKKNAGINFSQYITKVRMEEARKILLEEECIKVSDVAELVGISSISTFIRQFKNYYGCSPDQYRQTIKK